MAIYKKHMRFFVGLKFLHCVGVHGGGGMSLHPFLLFLFEFSVFPVRDNMIMSLVLVFVFQPTDNELA